MGSRKLIQALRPRLNRRPNLPQKSAKAAAEPPASPAEQNPRPAGDSHRRRNRRRSRWRQSASEGELRLLQPRSRKHFRRFLRSRYHQSRRQPDRADSRLAGADPGASASLLPMPRPMPPDAAASPAAPPKAGTRCTPMEKARRFAATTATASKNGWTTFPSRRRCHRPGSLPSRRLSDCRLDFVPTQTLDSRPYDRCRAINSCLYRRLVYFLPSGPAAETRCQKDSCQSSGWSTQLPSGDTVKCACILRDCAQNGAECR